jgi:hypothetical protein
MYSPDVAMRAFAELVLAEGVISVWLMNYGSYLDESTVEVFVGTAERAQERAAALTVERAKDREPSDLVEISPVPVSIFIDQS